MENRNTTILLAIIAALLVVIAVVFIAGGNKPAATPTATQPTQATGTPTGMPPTGSTGAAAGPPTKVPAGVTLDKYVSDYYSAILKGDFTKAWGMQPAANKAQGDAAAFKSTQLSYGTKAFKVLKVTNQSPTTTEVDVQQDLGANGKWVSKWVFQKSGGAWVADSKQTNMQ
jgi:hypothetical protein